MNKVMKKATSIIATTAMAFSIGMPAFAADTPTNEQVMPRSTTYQDAYGGSVEWGYGVVNAWCKYVHMDYDHQAVLQVNNSYHYGAWELAGVTPSYVEHAKGSQNLGSGNIRK